MFLNPHKREEPDIIFLQEHFPNHTNFEIYDYLAFLEKGSLLSVHFDKNLNPKENYHTRILKVIKESIQHGKRGEKKNSKIRKRRTKTKVNELVFCIQFKLLHIYFLVIKTHFCFLIQEKS